MPIQLDLYIYVRRLNGLKAWIDTTRCGPPYSLNAFSSVVRLRRLLVGKLVHEFECPVTDCTWIQLGDLRRCDGFFFLTFKVSPPFPPGDPGSAQLALDRPWFHQEDRPWFHQEVDSAFVAAWGEEGRWEIPLQEPGLVAEGNAGPAGTTERNRTPEAPAAGPAGTTGGEQVPEAPADRPDLVTLDQASGIVHKSKRTLERYKTNGTLPDPTFEGGGGRAALWNWRTLRPWLEQEFGIKLPETFPANRRS
jgi:hypothetical protein